MYRQNPIFLLLTRNFLLDKGTSCFTSNTLLIPKQDPLMVYIAYKFNKNNERKGYKGIQNEISNKLAAFLFAQSCLFLMPLAQHILLLYFGGQFNNTLQVTVL